MLLKYQEEYKQYQKALANLTAQFDAMTVETSSKKTKSEMNRQGLVTKDIRKIQSRMNNLKTEIDRLDGNLKYHETRKTLQIDYLNKRMKRIDQHLINLEKKGKRHLRKDHNDIGKFLDKLDEQSVIKNEQEEDGDDEKVVGKKPKRRGKKPKTGVDNNEEEDDDDDDDDEEVEVIDKADLKAQEDLSGQEYYVKKSWIEVDQPLPTDRPKVPKRHYFDQPETFDSHQFKKDIPLYSPKLEKLLEVLQSCDKEDLKTNPEDNEQHRMRKSMIFCEDIHDIRAAAGGLLANGWTFGMKLCWVKWKKEYFSSQDNKLLKTVTSKARQLTWLPSTDDGKDYKRFLILTRSKLGGVSGATMNDYAVQLIGAKGEDATYNHKHNLHGKNYRIVIIDSNFMEGIEVPSTYGHLFDELLWTGWFTIC